MITEKFEQLSKEIWSKITAANHYSLQYGEETITGSMLLEIVTQKFHNIKIIQTPKKKEATQGTDWEWYVGSDTFGWIRFIIQAKKLHPVSNNYEKLDHTITTKEGSVRQQDLLRNYAALTGAIPLYNFYNNFPTANGKHWHCPKPFDMELLGWTFTPLSNVESVSKIPKGKKRRVNGWCSFNKIHSIGDTFPIRCLFSCPNFRRFFTDKSLIGKPGIFLGEPFQKAAHLPRQIALARQTGIIDHFEMDSPVTNLGFYPKRIAVIDIGDELL